MTEDRGAQRTRSRPPGREPNPDRTPPHNLRAEEAILGAALLSRAALEILATKLTPGDFYSPGNGHVAQALTRAFVEGWPADPVTIADELGRSGLLDQAGGPGRLLELAANTPATSSADRYATIVHDHATLRRIIGAGLEAAEHAYALPDDAHEAVLRAQALFDTVAASNGSRAYSTLEIADVGALLDSDLEPEEPDFLTRADGRALLYAGKMHVFQGEPSSGKTWLALLAALEVLTMGGAVGYLDYEDTAKGVLGRLLALGAEPAVVRDRFAYFQPAGGFGPTERIELERILDRLNPDLVVIDGVAEALARDGLQEDRASEVVGWIEKLPRWLARTGAAVVMLDHVVKDREAQGRWARGSSAKLAAVDGATYQVKVVSPFSRHRDGKMKLIVAKDRPGGVGAIGDVAAVAHIEPKADGARVLIRLERDTGEIASSDTWKPTVLMARVSAELEASSVPLTVAALKALVHSDKPKLVSEAISRLVVEGYVTEKRSGRSTVLRSVKPYVDDRSSPPPPTEPPPGLFEDDPSIDPETGEPYEIADREPDPADPDSGPLPTF